VRSLDSMLGARVATPQARLIETWRLDEISQDTPPDLSDSADRGRTMHSPSATALTLAPHVSLIEVPVPPVAYPIVHVAE
jgi:hypothetical protein